MGRPSSAHSPSSALVAGDRERGEQEGLVQGCEGLIYTGRRQGSRTRLAVPAAHITRLGGLKIVGGANPTSMEAGTTTRTGDRSCHGGIAGDVAGTLPEARPNSVRLLAPLLCIPPTTSSRHCVIAISTRPPALEAPRPATGSIHTVQRPYS